ncbi:uncharacterized protein LOC121637324 isoform X2 [Melanotaenia boesemani]|uniref:uncharacterized protein LOC121637324 isoform X2 n=1 Tax=Melanotaenia boesemani TaxID=1250792 RepID=UPI001C03E804|nr:uncharacterized protein LOC121637324 isoform X2 [Melanotaenia boesemani]
MKTVCVAAVLLSLISVCQPAPLECKNLTKTVDQGSDVLGRWYIIGMSTTYCWLPVLFNSLLVPSFHVDFTPTERQHYYDVNVTLKSFTFCDSETFQLFYAVNSMYNTDGQKNLKMEEKGVLLQSGCPDCLVISEENDTEIIVLLSRRPVITADELQEFEKQAKCLGFYKPQIFGSDHDLGNCGNTDFESPDVAPVVEQRLKNMFSELFTCTTDSVLYYPHAAFKWVQQTWASLW